MTIIWKALFRNVSQQHRQTIIMRDHSFFMEINFCVCSIFIHWANSAFSSSNPSPIWKRIEQRKKNPVLCFISQIIKCLCSTRHTMAFALLLQITCCYITTNDIPFTVVWPSIMSFSFMLQQIQRKSFAITTKQIVLEFDQSNCWDS